MDNGYLIALVALAVLGIVLLLVRNPGASRGDDTQPSAEDRAQGTMALLPHQVTQMRKHLTAAFRL